MFIALSNKDQIQDSMENIVNMEKETGKLFERNV